MTLGSSPEQPLRFVSSNNPDYIKRIVSTVFRHLDKIAINPQNCGGRDCGYWHGVLLEKHLVMVNALHSCADSGFHRQKADNLWEIEKPFEETNYALD